jgi:hypothetical protein
VTPPEPKNLPASIHQRLLNQARASGRPFDELLRYYAIERFLHRLSQSLYRDRFVLKGALIFAAWGAPLGRSTRDVDLLAYTGNAIDEVVAVFKAICVQSVEPDGMTFDPATVGGESITEHAEYQGVRVQFQGHLGNARVRMQIDLGFGVSIYGVMLPLILTRYVATPAGFWNCAPPKNRYTHLPNFELHFGVSAASPPLPKPRGLTARPRPGAGR